MTDLVDGLGTPLVEFFDELAELLGLDFIDGVGKSGLLLQGGSVVDFLLGRRLVFGFYLCEFVLEALRKRVRQHVEIRAILVVTLAVGPN